MRSASIENQLAAMANSAERTNRPTSLIALGCVILVICIAFTAWSAGRFLSSRSRLRSEMDRRDRVEGILRTIAAKQPDLPDLESLYGREPLIFMAETINDVAKQVWDVQANNTVLPVNVGSKNGPTKLLTNEMLGLSRVDVRMVSPQPLEKILAFLEAVDKSEKLQRVNVSLIKLDPAPTGWNAQIQFTAYEKLTQAGR